MSIGQKVNLWQFLTNKEIVKVEIPEIQRDYVQGREDKKIQFSLERLLNDMYNALFNGRPLDLNYVYGKLENGVFVPIDGQQRLTTLLVLHIYAFAKEKKMQELDVLKNKFIYKTRETTQRFLRALIDYLPQYFDGKNKEIKDYIADSAWFIFLWERDPSVESFLNVIKAIDTKFKDKKFAETLMSDECPITYMGLKIDKMGNENDLYIKMNSRGKSLTDFEVFKSEILDYIESHNNDEYFSRNFIDDFKSLVDTEWMSMIWDVYIVPNKKKYEDSANQDDPAKECDMHYLKLLHWIILNHILPKTNGVYDNHLDGMIYNNGFFNFYNYQQKMDGPKAIKNIYTTFQLLDWLGTNDKADFKTIFENIIAKVEANERKERVILNAVTKYSVVMADKYDIESFGNWFRIINKLVKNTEIDKEDKYCRACQAIEELGDDCFQNSIEYFARMDYEKPNLGFFDGRQIAEEILKARLIMKNNRWAAPIKKAESFWYFEGQIGFMFKLQGISIDCLLCDDETITQFEENWKLIYQLFSEALVKKNDNLFRRALLCFGNYSIEANSSNTFFFEGGNEYYNWRRMLREDKSLSVFKTFFEDLKKNKTVDISLTLKHYIESYSGSDEFLYNLVKVPELFDYMRENRYKYDNESRKNRVVIYKKARLSAEYAEVFTYALLFLLNKRGHKVDYRYGTGYLYMPSSWAYIKKIDDNDMKVEFFNECFYLNDKKLLNNDGSAVNKVKDALALLMTKI